WLIEKYSQPNNLILDPFCGSGTTNLESLLLQRNSVGIDIDPFSRFLAQVKITPLDIKGLKKAEKYLLNSLINYHNDEISETDIPNFPYRDNWFNRDIIKELAYIKKTIINLETNEQIKNFLKICFSSIIRQVSNADNKCTRTVIRKKLNKQVLSGDGLKKFSHTLSKNVPKMIDFSLKCPLNINTIFPDNMDAKNILFPENKFDLAITSPPYVNAVDYPRTHQLELYWLEFYSGSLTPLKKKSIGTETVSVQDYQTLHTIGIKEADEVMDRIFNQDKKRAYIAFKYLDDMNQNLKEVYRVLKPGSRYIIVVGNNLIKKQLFESWKYLIELAEKIGFRVENYLGSEIIRHFITVPRAERINTDWVIILQK
ncbi:MAG TPA: DNA methyltransferase, partial [Allocoleopsis sp.]